MRYFIYVCLIVLGIIIILVTIYFILLMKLKKINTKLFKYREEEDLKENNALIIYQPSRHNTTKKISDVLKVCCLDKGYGFKVATLSKTPENYKNFEYVFFIAPVYFGQINQNFLNILRTNKIKNLTIIYNGLNKESNNEDKDTKKISLSKYKKIKVHTSDIEILKEFINKEVL